MLTKVSRHLSEAVKKLGLGKLSAIIIVLWIVYQATQPVVIIEKSDVSDYHFRRNCVRRQRSHISYDRDAKDDDLKPHIKCLLTFKYLPKGQGDIQTEVATLDLEEQRFDLSQELSKVVANKILETIDPLVYAISLRRDNITGSIDLVKALPPQTKAKHSNPSFRGQCKGIASH